MIYTKINIIHCWDFFLWRIIWRVATLLNLTFFIDSLLNYFFFLLRAFKMLRTDSESFIEWSELYEQICNDFFKSNYSLSYVYRNLFTLLFLIESISFTELKVWVFLNSVSTYFFDSEFSNVILNFIWLPSGSISVDSIIIFLLEWKDPIYFFNLY